jgi:hypothetical protein
MEENSPQDVGVVAQFFFQFQLFEFASSQNIQPPQFSDAKNRNASIIVTQWFS